MDINICNDPSCLNSAHILTIECVHPVTLSRCRHMLIRLECMQTITTETLGSKACLSDGYPNRLRQNTTLRKLWIKDVTVYETIALTPCSNSCITQAEDNHHNNESTKVWRAVFTAVLMKKTHWLNCYRCFRGTCWPHLQGLGRLRRIQKFKSW
jgi:hypothetical protein